MRMVFTNFLWIVPFICFFAGYFAVKSYVSIAQFSVPSVVGKSLYEGLTELSNHQLTVTLLRIQKEPDIPHGTILSQVPAAGQMVKPRQTVFVTVSEQPHAPIAPSLIGKSIKEIETDMAAWHITYKLHPLESPYPTGTCFAQYPAAGEPTPDKRIIGYIAKSHPKLYVMPDLVGMAHEQAIELFEPFDITPEILYPKRSYQANSLRVTSQSPPSGSLIYLSGPERPKIQLSLQ